MALVPRPLVSHFLGLPPSTPSLLQYQVREGGTVDGVAVTKPPTEMFNIMYPVPFVLQYQVLEGGTVDGIPIQCPAVRLPYNGFTYSGARWLCHAVVC